MPVHRHLLVIAEQRARRLDVPTRVPGMTDLLKLKEKERLPREAAAARLRAIADELASGNDVIWEQDGKRYVAEVPAEVKLKIELEVEDDEAELEIELSWDRG